MPLGSVAARMRKTPSVCEPWFGLGKSFPDYHVWGLRCLALNYTLDFGTPKWEWLRQFLALELCFLQHPGVSQMTKHTFCQLVTLVAVSCLGRDQVHQQETRSLDILSMTPSLEALCQVASVHRCSLFPPRFLIKISGSTGAQIPLVEQLPLCIHRAGLSTLSVSLRNYGCSITALLVFFSITLTLVLSCVSIAVS